MILASPADARSEICGPLDSGKIDTVGDPATVTITASPGHAITRYCVKAGTQAVYVDVDPPQESITISHPSGKDVSHYSYEEEPWPVTTSTTSTTTDPPRTTTTSSTSPPTSSTTSTSVTTTTAAGSTSTSSPTTSSVPVTSQTTTPATSTPPGPTPSLPTPTPELPETGPGETLMWLVAGACLIGLGLMARRAARS